MVLCSIYATLLCMVIRSTNALLALPVSAAAALVLAATLIAPVPQAHADELSDAQATLDEASAQLSSITKEYESLQSELSSLEKKISTTTEKVQDAQQAMLEGRENLSGTILSQYKSDGSLSLVNIFLSSESITDFTKSLTYYTSIQEDQAQQVAEQKELTEKFSAALEELDSQRDEQEDLVDKAEAKKSEAEKVVSDASAKVSQIKEKQAELERLKKQAEELAKKQAAEQAAKEKAAAKESKSWNTNTDREAKASESETDSSSGSDSSSSSSSNKSTASVTDSSSNKTSSGWKTGVASAYGGSSDKSTPNPGRTATGAVCNDTSMGVAIPMSWSGYRSYLGHAIEISYGGKTVIATINDCGYMGGGSRSLDLQPGVFKAFGYKTCNAWGLRTVSYRIL